jgi:hypothetical protein
MATLVLGTIGGAVGGPIGAMVGALAGNAIDHAVLRPARREGPRLSDLRVQTSTYGAPIPLVFGTMRVAGCVIWATDLAEHRDVGGGGKGRPDVATYSYIASFAVALSARMVRDVGRIWADGKLLRGAAGDWKAETGFRLHRGGEDQPPDPLIVAIEGVAHAPAHRGIAYAVFEDLALADFGNRIPQLTFEVIADDAPVDAGAVLAAAGDGAIVAEGVLLSLSGFAAQGSAREVAAMLAEAAGAWFAPGVDALAVRRAVAAVEVADAGAGGETGRQTRAVRPIETVPRVLTLAHYDPARDYQTGMQEARRPGAGQALARIDLPAVLEAGAARTIAEAMLARAETGRVRRQVALDIGAAGVAPGDCVSIAGETGVWRVAAAELARSVVTLELVPLAPETLARDADGGRGAIAPDLVAGETVVTAFELPPLDGTLAGAPRLVVAAAGGPGWRRAALLASVDAVAWQGAGRTALPAVMGVVAVVPRDAPATLEDTASAIEVELLHEGMTLTGADAGALDRGANLAMVGGELIQFARAVQRSPTRWRLTRLWRARRGMAAAHVAGERFVLIEAAALAAVPVPVPIGGTLHLLASGIGDAEPAAAQASVTGASIVPPAPVHLRLTPTADGGGVLTWVRRSRLGWSWGDAIDVPLGEAREAYRVSVGARIFVVEAPEAVVSAAERAAHATASVCQIGDHGASAPATIIL